MIVEITCPPSLTAINNNFDDLQNQIDAIGSPPPPDLSNYYTKTEVDALNYQTVYRKLYTTQIGFNAATGNTTGANAPATGFYVAIMNANVQINTSRFSVMPDVIVIKKNGVHQIVMKAYVFGGQIHAHGSFKDFNVCTVGADIMPAANFDYSVEFYDAAGNSLTPNAWDNLVAVGLNIHFVIEPQAAFL